MDREAAGNQSSERLLASYDEAENQRLRNSQDSYRSSTDESYDATHFARHGDYRDASESTNGSRGVLRGFRRIRRYLGYLIIIIAVILAGVFVFIGKESEATEEEPTEARSPPWYPTPLGGTVAQWSESYEKAEALVKNMTLPEKVNITTGTGWQMGLAVGNSAPAIHVGFPGLAYHDGPLGLRFADNSTAFPAGITVGATWNRELMYRRGKAHGNEARLKGINVLLGPCVGPLGRMPAGGRNWEVS